jgi:hypothetical protein
MEEDIGEIEGNGSGGGNFLDFLDEEPKEFGPVEHNIWDTDKKQPTPTQLPPFDISKY